MPAVRLPSLGQSQVLCSVDLHHRQALSLVDPEVFLPELSSGGVDRSAIRETMGLDLVQGYVFLLICALYAL